MRILKLQASAQFLKYLMAIIPHSPGGCIAQAWSVAEVLRAYVEDVLGIKP